MCDETEICLNTRGSYKCLCIDGYQRQLSSDGNSTYGDCLDIDECIDNSYNCNENENCFNTEAGFYIDYLSVDC